MCILCIEHYSLLQNPVCREALVYIYINIIILDTVCYVHCILYYNTTSTTGRSTLQEAARHSPPPSTPADSCGSASSSPCT